MGQCQFPYGLYQGGFDENLKPSGRGILNFTEGDVYQGYWQDGKQEGKGQLRGKTFVYDGTWSKGFRVEGTEKDLETGD